MVFRAVHTKVWTDPTFRRLPRNSKFVFLYLITNPHTHMAGIYCLNTHNIIYETGLELKDIENALGDLEENGMIQFDTENDVMWVVKMFTYQNRGGVRNIIGAVNQLMELHNTPLKRNFCKFYSDILGEDNLSSVYRRYIDDISLIDQQHTGYRYQDNEQDKDKDKDNNTSHGISTEAFSLCTCLKESILERDSKCGLTPKHFLNDKGWGKDARLLLDKDGRDFKEAIEVMKWCQQDEFWQNNILSMAKFRKQYTQLLLKMKGNTSGRPKGTYRSKVKPTPGKFDKPDIKGKKRS